MINESDIFEDNDLYIVGNKLKDSTFKILNEFDELFESVFKTDSDNILDSLKDVDISTEDIYLKSIEEDVQKIIDDRREKITKKKKIFNLEKRKHNDNSSFADPNSPKKPNHLRNEAKLLEESINNLSIPSYQELKSDKISECKLYSYHFFKSFYKKEIGKENNYIFNFKDNYLNDMSKIDKEFFEDFYKFDQKDEKMKFQLEKDILEKKILSPNDKRHENLSNDLIKREGDKVNFLSKDNINIKNESVKSELSVDLFQREHLMDIDDEKHISNNNSEKGDNIKTHELENNYDKFFLNNQLKNKLDEQCEIKKVNDIYRKRELVYEFAIYHPLKNNKTQEILIVGSSYLHQLKDKIYCVLDEIQGSENNEASFFFIENCFYNDTRNPNNKILSSKILENKIRKLNCFTSYGNEYNNTVNKYSNVNSSNINNNVKDTNNNSNLISGRDSNYNFLQNNNINNFNYEMGLDNNNKNFQNANEELKFAFYNKDLYSVPFYISNEIYDEVSMSDKKINEINFRIGYPYLFRHIDHCDHMIMLSDIRFLDECDRFDEESKCFVTFQKKLKRRICDACSFYYAKFISINDKITPDYKVLFYCESCLKKIHASEFKDPSMPNTLKLIPYFHD